VLGEPETAAEFREIFIRGKAWTDKNLFNGEYYIQRIDLADRSLTEQFDVANVYWNEEHGEIKYQIGEGCEIDQLLAQWHANLYGLGEIFDPAQARTALQALFRYNFKQTIGEAYNPCRVFALNDEAGLVLCVWPEHVRKPVIPVPYSQEVWTGQEYAAAALMVQFGLAEEALAVVRAARERYDGEKRNPWNEFECGSNYARSMSSYGLLLAYSGFEYDLLSQRIGFHPLAADGETFQSFWSLGTGWGVYRQTPGNAEIEVLYGTLEIQHLRLPALSQVKTASVDGKETEFTQVDGEVTFAAPLTLHKGSRAVFMG
jgi:uncharacterized protein (DUF608 family)